MPGALNEADIVPTLISQLARAGANWPQARELAERIAPWVIGLVDHAITAVEKAGPCPCPSAHHSQWDGMEVHLYCEREVGHPGPHSSDASQWEWD